MKNTFLLTAVLSAFILSASAQSDSISLPTKNGSLFFQKVVTVDSTPKQTLFDRGRMWAVDYFNNAKDVLQIADKEAGQITGKGMFLLNNDASKPVDFTFNVQFKDNKYRVQMYGFVFRSVNLINGSELSRSGDDVYFSYLKGKAARDLFQSQAAAQRRDEGYLIGFEGNIQTLEQSLYEYEAGRHKTDF